MKNNFFSKKPISNIYKKPSILSEVTSQIIYGEQFKILRTNKNWIKIKSAFDNYIGYIKNEKYIEKHKPTHKVYTVKAPIYIKPNLKSKNFLPFSSKISVINENRDFVEFEKNKWLKKKDIKKINHKEKNFLKIFKYFIETKYVWGGKSYKGIDCSALVQLFYHYNQFFYPRDTKDQIKFCKKKINKKWLKGDIIFWNGHVGVCINQSNLIHAYGPKKKVIIMKINYSINLIKKTAKLFVKKISNIKKY